MKTIESQIARLAEHREWLGLVHGDAVCPYTDEHYLKPDGIVLAVEPLQEAEPSVNMAVPGRVYSDEDEKQLRRLEEELDRKKNDLTFLTGDC